MKTKKILGITLALIIGTIFFTNTNIFSAQAETIEELEQQIQERTQERLALEKRAEEIRKELEQTKGEKTTLQQELNRINNERKSLDNTIKKTENTISELNLSINKNALEIQLHNQSIKEHSKTLESLLRGIEQQNSLTILETIISAENISSLFESRDNYSQLQARIVETTAELEKRKSELYNSSQTLLLQQQELEEEKVILGDQRLIVKSQEDKQNQILSETQKKESEHQKKLDETIKMISALDAEIRDYESKLDFVLNPSSLPKKGTVVFDWPLKDVYVTQRFGKTVSSERLYVSGSHSGVDFRAAIGTPVYAVADGVVKGVGDTDLQCPRASFGKWVFIEHTGIGLSTTYGHLSSWKVTEGQTVKKGDLIAYSGNTGHTTGPHLHLTTYATKGVDGGEGARVTERPSAACPGNNYRMPLAPTAAYLDPLAYLPSLDAGSFKE